jgi:sugar lactone lactonase YvrE
MAARLLLVLGLLAAGVMSANGQASAAPSPQTLAVVGGQPDDITTDPQGRLVWGDLARGTVDRLRGGRVVTVAAGLSVPEGVLVLPNGTLLVAEQGQDRIVRIRGGRESVVYTLVPVPGQEGVDGIGRDGRTGDLLVPDSPRGTVLRMGPNGGNARVVARGLGRPVDAAVDAHGNTLVPDENLGTLVVISRRGRVSHLGAFATPDDVAVAPSGRIWVTSLGDGGLWSIDPGRAPQRVLSGLGNPQGLTLDRCGDPIVVEQSSARLMRLLLNVTSAKCLP